MSWFPLAMRDVSFRAIILCFYYATTNIEHKPELKYTIPQITDFMKQRRAASEIYGERSETVHELSHLFYEFHNYEIKTKITTRLTFLILANVVSTLLTNPIDVCLTKIATQHKQLNESTGKQFWKYRGLFQTLRQVYTEEGAKKLFLGGIHPRFMFNMLNGAMFLFIYDRFIV